MNDLINTIELGQGNTPLIRLSMLEKALQWRGELWAKCEYQNPTGSFKDRGSVTEIGEAIKQKKNGVVCASTGNMAASLSAYATRVGLPCIVVIPQGTPIAKLQQALMYGATLIEIDGNYDCCVLEAKRIAQTKNYLLCGDYETRRKGQASIGEELAKSKFKFDAFICPVGNGTVGCAISEGFEKYQQYPQFIGVSGAGADPLVQAFNKNQTTFNQIKNPKTIASAINVGNPLDGKLTLSWISKTNGQLYSVTDDEILKSQKLLAITEGIFVEPSAAATIAVLSQLPFRSQNLVMILTGHGLKGGENMKEKPKITPPAIIEAGEFESKGISAEAEQLARKQYSDRLDQLLKDKDKKK